MLVALAATAVLAGRRFFVASLFFLFLRIATAVMLAAAAFRFDFRNSAHFSHLGTRIEGTIRCLLFLRFWFAKVLGFEFWNLSLWSIFRFTNILTNASLWV